MFTIEKAITEKQKKDAQKVRYRVYVEQDGKFQDCEFPGNIMKIPHDDESDTIILVAYYKRYPVGTISAYAYSKRLGLPIEETIEAIKEKFDLKKFIAEREFKTPLYSCGMLAIDKDYRGATGISIWLYRLVFEFLRRQGCEDVIATINYKIEKIIVAVGFCHLVPEAWYSEEIGNYIFLMYGKADDVAKVLEIQKVPSWCEREFSESTKIGLWRNEDIIVQGTRGDEFYWIIEGSVKVVARTLNANLLLAILYQGQTFGEMALFGGKRTATVLTNYCAAKILSKKEIMGIINNEEKSKLLVNILIDRLVEMNKKIKNRFSLSNVFAPLLSKSAIRLLPIRSFIPYELICRTGDCDKKAYLIKSGIIGIIVPLNGVETVISTMMTPSIFGYMVFFKGTRTASIIALEKTELYEISEEFFWTIFNDLKNRKKLIKNLLELIGHMNVNLGENFKREQFLQNFKTWLINYFKTADLEKRVSLSEDKIINQIPRLTAKNVAEEFGVSEKEIETLFTQLAEEKILNQDFDLLDEEGLKNFKFNF
ncbi:MAG: hypothetical protein US83_C0014G0006 [Candidatus Falkowbacteria bacterium GW2011_GWC2_38_22]|uniref:Cyclic nucleotide-binding domain-containing protein n=1 Tax=Candidatus Falkowbacteria bacterium GW2011_GWE1_38_31 TaxID=1618638 RepID=A0A0G0MXI3_9BACT|nr:MAG: hypothetical protein US73_C0011G0006 [Candidatus Falkowbacteria bacterium GW2011_GWF2_38_1205]KKQ60664.1 MAG: hypothetical protein US83_C0014G0006 [Candidatus Falkowbacteria bacterium GW2011_GWC2_38_22]KKQ62804.1 MAG: hypothetical protein US84_C0011G0006 [Candidatus Falkowbacteria bacterium GW2011_GWF1_38_22]KKQ64916.1 MAG: hypothetical protein US87_C0011G0006 [Candidatus Falkowbacteria bacterium GW2011_GWE2_38_254]KKQ69636.1 MAG: hypothetical protein US91_C0011G0006 [Candidatus Falkowb